MADLPRCTFSTEIHDYQGKPIRGVKFFYEVHSGVVDAVFIQPLKGQAETDKAGKVRFSITQGASATISGNHPSFQTPRTIVVPAQTSYDLMLLADLAAGTIGTTFDVGSVLFTDSGGLLKQDASNLHYDEATNSLQLGGPMRQTEIATPSTPLANTGFWYTKDVGGLTQPFFMGDDGVERPLGGSVSNPIVSGSLTTALPTAAGALGRATNGRRAFTMGNGSEAVPIIGAVNVKMFGAKGNVITVADGAMIATQSTIACSTSHPFVIGRDENKKIAIVDTGTTENDFRGQSGVNDQAGTIVTVLSTSQVVVSFTAVASVTGKQVKFGSDDTAALVAAHAAASNYWAVYYPPGDYCVSASGIELLSNQRTYGEGMGVSNIHIIGNTRDASGVTVFDIADGVHDVTVENLSIYGMNYRGYGPNGSAVTNIGALTQGVHVGTGATGTIENLTFSKVEIAYTWGFGMRSDGDFGDQSSLPPTVKNIDVLNCRIHHNGDSALNLNTGGGLLVQGGTFTHCLGAIEFGGSRLRFVHNYVAYSHGDGVVVGGVGDPSVNISCVVENNIIEFCGVSGASAAGIAVGANAVYVLIQNNLVRTSALIGVSVTGGNPDFATLTRQVIVRHNSINSNGIPASGVGFGISVQNVNGTVIEDNDLFDDGVSGYSQYYGIRVAGDRVEVLRNRAHHNIGIDYSFGPVTNCLFARDDSTSVVNLDPNGFLGVVNTSGTTVTWQSGTNLFSANWVGVPIKINSVSYLIDAVAAAPSGTCSFVVTPGSPTTIAVTRLSGPSFDTDWVGQYFRVGVTYYPIVSVADGSHLTLNSLFGIAPTGSTWNLYGSTSLTLLTTAGSQSGVDYAIDAHVVYPSPTFQTLTTKGAIIPATSDGTPGLFSVDISAGRALSLANNDVGTPFGPFNNFGGKLTITEDQSFGVMCDFSTVGGSMVKGTEVGSRFSTTVDTADKINVYLVANAVTIQNKSGFTVRLRIISICTRSANV